MNNQNKTIHNKTQKWGVKSKSKKIKSGLKMSEYAINLCDIAVYFEVDEYYFQYLAASECTRFYLGSYFCGKYFCKCLGMLSHKLFPFFATQGIKVTLVLPSPMEEDLNHVKQVARDTLLEYEDVIDELVVNDFAMLAFALDCKEVYGISFRVTAGRLMNKNFRDTRYVEFDHTRQRVIFPEMLRGRIDALELDQVAADLETKEIPEEIEVHCHTPYVYQTCGQNCEFASMMRPDALKFKRSVPMCMNGCMRAFFMNRIGDVEYLHLGKAVFTKRKDLIRADREFNRFIYFPFDEWQGRFCE